MIFLILLLIRYTLAVQCRDGSFCPGIQTCCLTVYGVGCCPYSNAICCDDGKNCCPNGYQCYSGGCIKNTKDNSTLFNEERISINAIILTPSFKNNQGPKLFEVIKCLEDLRPLAKEIKQALEELDILKIDSLFKLSEKLLNLNKANKLVLGCYSKFKSIIYEYFN